MTPRKSHWIFLVLGLAFLCLLLAAPAAQANLRHGELNPSAPSHSGIVDAPTGDPKGGGGGDGGDPDDYSNLLREPNDPSLDPGSGYDGVRIDVKRQVIWTDPMFYAVLLWLGLDR
jgi:hypothetical protein